MLRDQDSQVASEIHQTVIDPDTLIILSVKGRSKRFVGAASFVPRFYNQPLHARDVPHTLSEMVLMHTSTQKLKPTHSLVMSGADLSRALYSETPTDTEADLRHRLEKGSGKLKDSLGISRRINY